MACRGLITTSRNITPSYSRVGVSGAVDEHGGGGLREGGGGCVAENRRGHHRARLTDQVVVVEAAAIVHAHHNGRQAPSRNPLIASQCVSKISEISQTKT